MNKKEIRVYPRDGIWGSGYACDHAGVDPKEADDIVLCKECAAAREAGAEIVKMKD
jgi:hypothetical protein